MFLNKEIGGGGIDGAQFQEELMYLDSLGKKRIEVWINSVGGSVVDGYSIYNAILKSKTPVDTYNVGVAASIAGVIWMAGRKRVMSDYAKLMMHPIQGTTDDKAYKALMDSITMMLQSKSKCTMEEVLDMVTTTTWLSASECLSKGFATEIEVTKDNNKKYQTEPTMLWQQADEVLNSLIIKTKTNMTNITNALNLNVDAKEESIVEAINSLTTAKNLLAEEKAELEAKLTEAENQVTEIKAKLDEANDEVITNKATALVESFKNRIGEGAINSWVNLAKNNLEETKTMLEALPLNVASEKLDNAIVAPSSAQAIMNEINNKLKNNK